MNYCLPRSARLQFSAFLRSLTRTYLVMIPTQDLVKNSAKGRSQRGTVVMSPQTRKIAFMAYLHYISRLQYLTGNHLAGFSLRTRESYGNMGSAGSQGHAWWAGNLKNCPDNCFAALVRSPRSDCTSLAKGGGTRIRMQGEPGIVYSIRYITYSNLKLL